MDKEVVVLIPCYDPNEEIMDNFLEKLSKEFDSIVLIDDGCSKKHERYMKSLAKKYPVIKHDTNLGKGRAIKDGINYILDNYSKAKVIVTADCDGQHSVEDIKKCANKAKEEPNALILGCRDFDDKNVPLKSKLGNKITRNIFYSFLGTKISDTQTGLRAASIDVARILMDISGERYEYETNVLIMARKKNIPIIEEIIETIYISKNETSHFNPIKDSLRIYKLFTKYILVILIAYILEVITFKLIIPITYIPFALLVAKAISTLVIVIFNKYINIYYTIINYLLVTIILLLVNKYYIVLKIGLDIIMFIIYLLLYNNKKR